MYTEKRYYCHPPWILGDTLKQQLLPNIRGPFRRWDVWAWLHAPKRRAGNYIDSFSPKKWVTILRPNNLQWLTNVRHKSGVKNELELWLRRSDLCILYNSCMKDLFQFWKKYNWIVQKNGLGGNTSNSILNYRKSKLINCYMIQNCFKNQIRAGKTKM